MYWRENFFLKIATFEKNIQEQEILQLLRMTYHYVDTDSDETPKWYTYPLPTDKFLPNFSYHFGSVQESGFHQFGSAKQKLC